MGPEHHNQEGRLAEILGSCLLGIYINKSSVFFSFIFFYKWRECNNSVEINTFLLTDFLPLQTNRGKALYMRAA